MKGNDAMKKLAAVLFCVSLCITIAVFYPCLAACEAYSELKINTLMKEIELVTVCCLVKLLTQINKMQICE